MFGGFWEVFGYDWELIGTCLGQFWEVKGDLGGVGRYLGCV